MRDHEIQLIGDLVEGRLQDETEARALISSSPELQAEYEAQKLAFEALSAAQPVSMTDSERASLHRDLWTTLRAAPTTQRRNPWYYRIVAPVAAGALVVVGLIGVLNQAGDSGAGFEDVGSGLTNAESAEGGSVSTTAADAGGFDAGVDAGEDGSGGGLGLLPETPTASQLAEALSAPVESFYAAEAAAARGTADPDAAGPIDESTEEQFERCTLEKDLPGFTLVGVGPVEPSAYGRSLPPGVIPYLMAIPAEADLVTAPIVFLDRQTCELIYIDG